MNKDINDLQFVYEKILKEDTNLISEGSITIDINGKPTAFPIPDAEIHPGNEINGIPVYIMTKWGQISESVFKQPKFIMHLPDQTSCWFKTTQGSNAILHREDGPAVIYNANDIYEWYLEGEEYKKEDYLNKVHEDGLIDDNTLLTISMTY